MAGPMKRGANVALTQEIPGLTGIVVGVRVAAGAERILLDNQVRAAILCDSGGHALSGEHFVFFNQLTSPDLSVRALEEALGDDTEQIEIDLSAVPAEVDRIVLIAYLNDAIAARRSFGQLRDCTLRVLDLKNNSELVRSENLAPALGPETAVALGEVYRAAKFWKFKIVGEGYAQGITGVAADFRIPL